MDSVDQVLVDGPGTGAGMGGWIKLRWMDQA